VKLGDVLKKEREKLIKELNKRSDQFVRRIQMRIPGMRDLEKEIRKMKCKNCEFDRVTNSEGLCFDCVDELLDEGNTCRTNGCDEPVFKEGDYCGECKAAIECERADAEREERILEKNKGK